MVTISGLRVLFFSEKSLRNLFPKIIGFLVFSHYISVGNSKFVFGRAGRLPDFLEMLLSEKKCLGNQSVKTKVIWCLG